MQLTLTLLSRLADFWHSLSDGTRDNIIGGLIVAVVLAAVGLVIKFGKRIARAVSRTFESEARPPNQQQEVKVKIEVAPATPITAEQAEPVQAPRTTTIPRPPAVGFVARRDHDGRDIVERLKEELAPKSDQLVVLWGAGGVGKTTLAAETARALRKTFEGGIAWISAEGRQDFGLSTLLDEIAGHLRRPDLRQLALEVKSEQVHQFLADSPTPLIVLDNFETISPEEQDRCAAWLANRVSCPALMTSRDAAAHARPVHILAMSLLEANEFLQKLIAEARKPQAFVGLDHNKIIQAADRIPLVLQWVVKQIDSAKQPQTVLEDLAHGKGDAAQRVFDRSFELTQLGDDGRTALLALSMFVPGASREALAKVAGFEGPERLNDAVQQLAELWLIETTEGNERLSVEGLTRELAKARFLKDERAGHCRERFVAYFVDYAKTHAQPTPEDYETLEKEKDNLLNAMDVSFEMKDWDSVIGIANVIACPTAGLLDIHGFWDEALKRNEQALNAARTAESQVHVAGFAHNQAMIHQNRGEHDDAWRLYNESLEITKHLRDQRGIAITQHQLALLAQEHGQFEEARRLYNESLEMKKHLGDQRGISNSLHNLAAIAQAQGDLGEARRLYNESLEIAKKHGDQGSIAITLHQLAMLAQDQGDLKEAGQLYNESLEIERKRGNQRGIAGALHQLATLLQAQGDLEEARRLYEESLEIEKRLGYQSAISSTLHNLAAIDQAQGHMEEARRRYNESLEIAKKLGDQESIAISLAQLGLLSKNQGNMEDATRLFREALEIFEKLRSPYAEKARRDLARVEGRSP